jgi:rhodanese-related sulfurtransferase
MEQSIDIQPSAVKAMFDAGEDFLLIDVREPEELLLAKIEGAKAIPLRTVPENLVDLQQGKSVVFMCHGGVRSTNAALWARKQGIEDARSMRGGIDAWSVEIDTTIPRY